MFTMTNGKTWNFDNTNEFGKHVRQSVPFYDEMQDQIVSIMKYFLDVQITNNILDLGASTGELIDRILNTYSTDYNLLIEAVDSNENMISTLKDKFGNRIAITHSTVGVNDTKYTSMNNIITSFLFLQFIKKGMKNSVLRNIYKNLRSDGAFIITEKVSNSNIEYNDMFNSIYTDFKSREFSSDEILQKERQLRGAMHIETQEKLIERLKSAGFDCCEVIFKYNNFVTIVARKQNKTWG